MKKIFLLLFVLASSLCMNAQNIKYVELTQDGVFTPSPVSDEWRDVDSIVVTGTLGNKNYYQLRDLAEYFDLTGLNLENCKLVDDCIGTMAFKPRVPAVCVLGIGEDTWNYGYESIKTEERYYRVNLKHVTLPYGLKKICYGAFYYNNLETLDLPESVESIEYMAFAGCRYLKSFILHASSPSEITLGEKVFEDISEDVVLYVPQGAKSAFEADETWGTAFKTIKEYDVAGIHNAVMTSDAGADRIFTLDGRYVGTDINALAKGMYIVNGKKILK